MTFDAHWDRLCDANPLFLCGATRMTVEVSEFRRLMERAFKAGAKRSGPAETAKAAEDFKGVGKGADVFGGMFGDLFKGLGR